MIQAITQAALETTKAIMQTMAVARSDAATTPRGEAMNMGSQVRCIFTQAAILQLECHRHVERAEELQTGGKQYFQIL